MIKHKIIREYYVGRAFCGNNIGITIREAILMEGNEILLICSMDYKEGYFWGKELLKIRMKLFGQLNHYFNCDAHVHVMRLDKVWKPDEWGRIITDFTDRYYGGNNPAFPIAGEF